MKSKAIAFLLWLLLGFLLGFHRFYLHKWFTGVLYIVFTAVAIICMFLHLPFIWGIVGLYALVDLFTIGTQVDSYNLKKQMMQTAENMSQIAYQQAQNQSTPQQSAQISSANNENDIYKKLSDLKSLLDSGIITQAEFDAEKTKILNS